jgi:UDP-glucose 4-epimerase
LKSEIKGADCIIHEAAIPSVARSVRDPIRTNDANIMGTLTVLVAARDLEIDRVVFASSSSIYGDTPTLPKIETMPPNPKSPYALTKYAGERYCELFNELYGLKAICLRYFNVFGPKQDFHSEYSAVIPSFISNALSKCDLKIFGDGSQTRDFTYVKDVVQATLKAAETTATGIFNIASGKRISINELAEIIIRLTGSEVKINHLEPRLGDVRDSLADISKARVHIGYAPEYSIEIGLQETIGWFRTIGQII